MVINIMNTEKPVVNKLEVTEDLVAKEANWDLRGKYLNFIPNFYLTVTSLLYLLIPFSLQLLQG